MELAEYKREYLAYCLELAEKAGSEYAIWHANWAEEQAPFWLRGLEKRVRQDLGLLPPSASTATPKPPSVTSRSTASVRRKGGAS